MANIKVIVLGGVALLLLIAVAVGGYFLFIGIDKQHQENVESLADFGTKVIPIKGAADTITVGVEGELQLPPDIGEKNLSPTEKIIISLSKEKEELAAELTIAKEKVSKLENEVAQLRAYRSENERFAPLPLEEERLRAQEVLTEYFAQSEDAKRFNSFQREAMTLAASAAYLDVLREYRLSFDEDDKDLIINRHLPAYGFCIADGIVFVPNSRSEERSVLAYLKSGDTALLSDRLAKDLEVVEAPCLKPLSERINAML